MGLNERKQTNKQKVNLTKMLFKKELWDKTSKKLLQTRPLKIDTKINR